MVDYVWAIKRPFEDIKTLVIGMILGAIPLVSQLTIPGYALISGKTAAAKKKLQEWGDWGNVIVKSILIIIITLIYMLPAIIVSAIFFAPMLTSLLAVIGGDMSAMEQIYSETATVAAAGIGILIAGILALIASYILPAALMKYILKDNFGSAFDFGGIFKRVLNVEYFITWIVTIIYSAIVGIISAAIGGVLAIIPFIGWIFALLISGLSSFILLVTQYSMFGQLKYD